MENEFVEQMEKELEQVKDQTDIYFMKLVEDFIAIYDKISYMYATQSKRIQTTDNKLQDILHKMEDYTLNEDQLKILAVQVRDLRKIRRHTNIEYELECKFTEVKKDLLFDKDIRRQTGGKLLDVLKSWDNEWNNRIITNDDFKVMLGITEKKEPKSRSTKLKERDQLIIELHNTGMSQTDIAKKIGVSQPSVCTRIKKLKERGVL